MAFCGIRGRLELLDDQRMILNGFISHRFFKIIAKGIVAQDADDDRGFCLGESSRRPFDELGEVKNEGCLDLILTRLRGLGEAAAVAKKQSRGRACDEAKTEKPVSYRGRRVTLRPQVSQFHS